MKNLTLTFRKEIPKSIRWSDKYLPTEEGQIVIGESRNRQIGFNLNDAPHVLIAGEGGSGKTVLLKTILWQGINAGSRIYMIDLKGGVEFGLRYERYGEVIVDRKRALAVFEQLIAENRRCGDNLCRIVVFIDEIAALLNQDGVSKEESEIAERLRDCLNTLLSRTTGINLVISAQRPDAKIFPGQNKNNIPVRICGRFADRPPSEIMLGNSMAQNLPDTIGRFLYRMGNEIIEFQAYYFDDDRDLPEGAEEQKSTQKESKKGG